MAKVNRERAVIVVCSVLVAVVIWALIGVVDDWAVGALAGFSVWNTARLFTWRRR